MDQSPDLGLGLGSKKPVLAKFGHLEIFLANKKPIKDMTKRKKITKFGLNKELPQFDRFIFGGLMFGGLGNQVNLNYILIFILDIILRK